jgi:biopolymer transport protein ExbD
MARKRQEEVVDLNMTPMIDVVFQLLIFFMCAMNFPNPEGVLKSWLPKTKGQGTGTPPPIELNDVRLVMRMEGEDTTLQYSDPGAPTGFSSFSQAQGYDFQTKRDEVFPDWNEVTKFLAAKRVAYRGTDPQGLPVVLDFSQDVPMKRVVELLDICAGLEVTNIQIAAPELPYN